MPRAGTPRAMTEPTSPHDTDRGPDRDPDSSQYSGSEYGPDFGPGFRPALGPEPGGASDPAGAPRFRLVSDHASEATPSEDTGPSERWSTLSSKLLVSEDAWRERWAEAPEGMVLARADIPLLAAIARIRSDADAALALTGVLETLSTDVWVGLPCAVLDDTEFGLVIPEGIALESIAETIDEALQGQVRSTDLQGPLRERSRARVELL